MLKSFMLRAEWTRVVPLVEQSWLTPAMDANATSSNDTAMITPLFYYPEYFGQAHQPGWNDATGYSATPHHADAYDGDAGRSFLPYETSTTIPSEDFYRPGSEEARWQI